jgi:hypothetical protein
VLVYGYFVYIESFLYFISSGILTCRLVLNFYVLYHRYLKIFGICLFGIYILNSRVKCVTCLANCVLVSAVSPEEGGSLLKKRRIFFECFYDNGKSSGTCC